MQQIDDYDAEGEAEEFGDHEEQEQMDDEG